MCWESIFRRWKIFLFSRTGQEDFHENLEDFHISKESGIDRKHEETKKAHRNGCDLQKRVPLPEKDSSILSVCLTNMENEKVKYQDTLHKQAVNSQTCSSTACKGSLYKPSKKPLVVRPKEELIKEASNFLKQFYDSLPDGNEAKYGARLDEVTKSILAIGTYNLTYDELEFGAITAWRNASRCVGRIQYSNLKVFDYRHVVTATEMFEAICSHLEYATNNGNIRSAITFFPHLTSNDHPFRVWNGQVITYAGYKYPDGSVVGDAAAVEFTNVCKTLGWESAGTDFDVLPLVLQANGEDPELFDIPPHLVSQVLLKHPQYPSFEELGLKWYSVPVPSNLSLDCGGLLFTAIPFNGWYTSAEIAKDLCEVSRCNKGKVIGEQMKLDTSTLSSLWLDRVALELNIAVLYSYQKQGVTIIDHHTASASFLSFMENEYKTRGGCPADWVWIVPSPLTSVFHQEMMNYKLKPSYEYMDNPWLDYLGQRRKKKSEKSITEARVRHIPATVLYATETGCSEKYARQLYEALDVMFRAQLIRMDQYNIERLSEERMLFVVTSTFGDGEPPRNGEKFFASIRNLQETGDHSKSYANISFSVFGLGSSAYVTFCSAGYQIDNMLCALGMKQIHEIGVGDALKGQEASFEKWSRNVLRESCAEAQLDFKEEESLRRLTNAVEFRIVPTSKEKLDRSVDEYVSLLSIIYSKQVIQLTISKNKNLQSPKSKRRTHLVVLSQNEARTEEQFPNYQPGDHLGVFPRNDDNRVQKILEKVTFETKNVSADDLVSVESKKNNQWIPEARLPSTTLRVALTYLLDITSPPDQMFLRAIASFATNPNEKEKLNLLSQNIEVYEEWIDELYPPLDVVLETFSSVKVPAALLLGHLSLLQPRYYSLSSSVNACPGQAYLTVGVVEFNAGNNGLGPKRQGMCSNWIESLTEGAKVPVLFHANHNFHMPSNSTEPMILIGAGTGIAPFMSFFYHRRFEQMNGKRCGKVFLYFGCRRRDHDLIYGEEIQQFLKEAVISEFHLALSREPGEQKTYVQDLIHIDGKSVYNHIVKQQGHVYISGDINMAQSVEEELCRILCQKGSMNENEAGDFIKRLSQQNRYHKDVY